MEENNNKIVLTDRQRWALYQIVNGVREKKLPEQSLGGYAGTGKAQPLHSKIATPKGFVTMGEIKIGDDVCTPNGKISKVTGIYPQGTKSIYKVWFSDNNFVECCDDHLWEVENVEKGKVVLPLSYIRKNLKPFGEFLFFVKKTDPVKFESKKTRSNPYFVGWFVSRKSKNYKNLSSLTNSVNELKDLGIYELPLDQKFIPSNYLQNSKKVRLGVLQGIMDKIGRINSKGTATCAVISERLADDIVFLVESLGGICKKNFKNRNFYLLEIFFENIRLIFRNYYKRFNLNSLPIKTINRCIKSVEYVGEREAQCIMIDDPDKLYLTDHFIPTHNTTIIKYLTKFFPGFAVAAYTGKAANVLRKKGIYATTIHSKIYKPSFENGEVYFDLDPDMSADGFIIDEASMVSDYIYDDLKSFGLPMIFIGDHGQLEPVDSKLNLMLNPDYTLEEIHRNAGDIAKFAEHLRMGFASRGFRGNDGSVDFLFGKSIDEKILCDVSQVICAYNKTRVDMNEKIRKALGLEGLLNVGERIMCLKNNRNAGLFNGMQGIVRRLYKFRNKLFMDFEFDGEILEGVLYDDSCFGQESYKLKQTGPTGPNPFDYAYCITAHKAQGDEWDDVLVLEQNCKNWSHKRWAYTAASRAKRKLRWKILP